MGLIRHYLRVFFRSHFKPINVRTAKKWEFNSSLVYFLTSWMVLGVAIKMFMKGSEQGTLGSARVYEPYDMMVRYGTKKEFTVLDITEGGVEKQVLSLKEVEEKATSKNI